MSCDMSFILREDNVELPLYFLCNLTTFCAIKDFCAKPADVVGQPLMSYLIQRRMTITAELLRDTDLSLSGIAERVSYHNPYAFATAFKRLRGEAPGRYRKI